MEVSYLLLFSNDVHTTYFSEGTQLQERQLGPHMSLRGRAREGLTQHFDLDLTRQLTLLLLNPV